MTGGGARACVVVLFPPEGNVAIPRTGNYAEADNLFTLEWG